MKQNKTVKPKPTYSSEQIALLLDMSIRWVQQQANRHDIGHIEGNGRRYLAGDLRRIQGMVNKDETRGRPRNG
tara:strand:+ start:407 stop:625 length:219 start_codon:yes stop_codon:yes gene_type:complete